MPHRVREIKLPRQFPLERPLGCLPKGGPRPEVGGVVDQVAVDRAWQGFCKGAEEDLIGIFGFDEAEGKKYCGSGEPTRFVWRRILPVQRAGVGRSSLARAWEWLAKELAWVALLMGKMIKQGSCKAWAEQSGSAWRRLCGGSRTGNP